MRIGSNIIKKIVVAACTATCISAHTQTPEPVHPQFPPHIQSAIAEKFESETRRLYPLPDTAMMRYDPQGKLDVFHCARAMGMKFEESGGEIGAMVIGECPGNSDLNANFGREQVKNFSRAIVVAGLPNFDASANSVGAEQIVSIEEQGSTYIHLHQLVLSGVGGANGHGMASIESMLMLPANGKNAVFIQSHIQNATCASKKQAEQCEKLRKTLRETARHVQLALTLPVPAPEPMPESLVAGKRTMCDSVVMTVRRALKQSITRQQPVTETIVYKQTENRDVRNGMITAAKELADGIELNVAARNVGIYCLAKPFMF